MPAPRAASPSRRGRLLVVLAVLAVAALLVGLLAGRGGSGEAASDPGPAAPPSVPAAPPPDVPDLRPALAAGAAPPGSRTDPVPPAAVHVSPSGDDAAAGTRAAPLRTAARAVEAAPDGGTVVLHAGSYHERIDLPEGRALTLQPAPGDEVWFDGTREVTGWVADGPVWRFDGWTAEFDSSPTYTRGAPDNTEPGFRFVDPAHPLAAHPDMLFVDGVAQQQVATRAEVVPGTFAVDDARDRLWLGTDPAGRAVRASDLDVALTVLGAGSTVRGIGFRGYATSVPQKGTVRVIAPDVTVEDVVVQDNATQGLFVGGRDQGEDVVVRAVTLERNGLIGMESSYADGLVVERLRAVGNNTERFNAAPVSGGAKLTRARGLTVRDSVFADNLGTGLWFDESVFGATVTGNDVLRNTSNGIAYEISSQAVLADNLVVENGRTGIKINDASGVEVWANTVVGNGERPLWVVQDERVATDLDVPGHDPRQELPDPTVTWVLGPVTVADNVIGGGETTGCLICAQDGALRRTAGEIGLTVSGNAYLLPGPDTPVAVVTWPEGGAAPVAYPTVAAFRAATGQEVTGVEYPAAVLAGATVVPELLAAQDVVAVGLPGAVAELLGLPAGTRRLGARP
ncbi:right-handed parallel beta-helix repeat-containing protein [Blastococcus sp. URHD0036]|uniref:right-handed parallel beta-helix repeat-containing protein n=1 Tax=Blastococcus sp. URHD0036 TaxID=1380356 RepID=UPI00068E0B53|nr:right-handed parallel beta-helix repeat-containing protein [Blastococcus sp. URHD0036]